MILVTGATGHLGGAIIRHLLKEVSPAQLVALVRDEARAAHLRDAGITVRTGDYHQPASLAAAFAGVDKAVLVSSSDFNDRLGQHKNVIDAAAAAGVRHLSYTGISLKDVQSSVLRPFMEDHFRTEDYLRESGIPWTFMRHNLYAEMIPFYIGRQVLEQGRIAFPAGDGCVPFALRDEMAEANARVLLGEGHEHKIYNITGPASYSFQDMVDILSRMSGKEISYTVPAQDSFIASLKATGLPEQVIDVAVAFAAAMRNGDFDLPGDDLQHLLGRKPAGLDVYLQQAYSGS